MLFQQLRNKYLTTFLTHEIQFKSNDLLLYNIWQVLIATPLRSIVFYSLLIRVLSLSIEILNIYVFYIIAHACIHTHVFIGGYQMPGIINSQAESIERYGIIFLHKNHMV